MTGIGRKAPLAVTLLLAVACSVDSRELGGVPSQRLRPPDLVKCSRDRLTSFQGRILEYRRANQEAFLRVRTDEETTESFTLKWEASQKAEAWFLLRGEEFKAEDWKQIESAPGKLHDGMRIIVWSCDDGSKPVFDWRPNTN